MKNIRKLLCGILALVMVFSLIGCKKTADEMAEDPATPSEEIQIEEETVKPEKETEAPKKETEATEAPTEKPTEAKEEEQEETTKPTTASKPSGNTSNNSGSNTSSNSSKPSTSTTPTTAPTEAPKPTEAPTTPPTEAPKPTEPAPTTPPATTPPATEHTHIYGEKVTPAGCTSKGYTTYTCACGNTYTEFNIDPTGHNYSEAVTAPTCTAGGYTTYTCSACGEKYTGNETSAKGHSWSNWETTKAATNTAEGERKRTCSCGAVETEVIPIEVIDLGALCSYGISYGVGAYGYEADYGCYAGYFPGGTCTFTSMEEGKAKVRAKIDSDTGALIAAYGDIWREMEDGTIARTRLNVGITDNGNNSYTIFMYYG